MPPIYTGPTKVSLPGIDKVYYGQDLVYKKDHADYLTFTALASGSTVYLANTSNTPDCEYSFDGGEHWNAFPTSTSSKITLSDVGQSIIVRGDNPTGFSKANNNYSRFAMTGSIGASGSVMSLIDGTGETDAIPCDYCFSNLFYSNSSLVAAPEFPAMHLAQYCYQNALAGTRITASPELPATELAVGCYHSMLYNNSALTVPPVLPATELVNYCYMYMMRSTSVKVGYSSTYTGGTLFFTCPSLTGLTQPVFSMFTGTKGTTSNPTAGQAWYYI